MTPGDEVICINDQPYDQYHFPPDGIVEGGVYVIVDIFVLYDEVIVRLEGTPNLCPVTRQDLGFYASRFRKTIKRDLSAWLSTTDKFEEPKRAREPA